MRVNQILNYHFSPFIKIDLDDYSCVKYETIKALFSGHVLIIKLFREKFQRMLEKYFKFNEKQGAVRYIHVWHGPSFLQLHEIDRKYSYIIQGS